MEWNVRKYMQNTNQHKLILLCIIAILSFGTVVPALAFAAPVANTDKDWQYVNGNSWAQNYSPETQITKDNVGQLEVKWLLPLEGKSRAPAALQSLTLNEGSTTPPIVRDGKVFVTTNYLKTYGVDAKTGKQLWAHDYVINATDLTARLPLLLSGGGLQGHLHGIRYWEGGNSILVSGMACDFYGVDINTGKTSFWVKDLCKDIPGNLYMYRQGGVSQTNIGTYDKGKQFIFVLPGSMHSTAYEGDFRHTTIGIDMNTKQIVWKVFSFPPQDKPTKDWATQECSIGYFGSTPCSEVQAKAPANLEWDWAQPGQNPSIWGGVTANWGEIVVDEDTGIIYTQTGNQGPYTYVGATPGPRLYGSTIMAIDTATGKRIWWLQPFPRDMYDYDCNWSGILANDPTLGKVYVKGCKEGRIFVINAVNGKPVYVKDVIADQINLGQITQAAATEPYQGKGGNRYHLNDPFSYYDMRQIASPDNSTYCGRPCNVYPAWMNGIFGTDMSYDPQTGTLIHYATALQTTINMSPAPVPGKSMSSTKGYPTQNTTIVARDLATGNIKWSWFYSLGQQRSHLVVTPSLVFTGFTDGYMRFFDKEKGTMLREMNLGSDLRVGVTTGQDADGNQKIFTIVGTGSSLSPRMPGTLVAIGLSKAAAQGTTTVTTTQATTITTTSTTTSISTSVTTSATTVTSSSVSTVTSTSATTVTTTSAAQTVTTTATTTAPAKTITETSTAAETMGPITYGAIAVAVIAIAAAAFLVMRKK